MVGRYVNYFGEQFDDPTVRFGNLSMFPPQLIPPRRARC